jgi:hypothetical protein
VDKGVNKSAGESTLNQRIMREGTETSKKGKEERKGVRRGGGGQKKERRRGRLKDTETEGEKW